MDHVAAAGPIGPIVTKDDVPTDRASWVALLVRMGVAEGLAGVIYDGIVATSPALTPAARSRAGRRFVVMAADGITPSAVLAEVLAQAGITREHFFSGGRHRSLVNVRTVAVAALRMRLGLSTPAIGAVVELDHTTVLYHLDRCARTPALLDLVETVLAALDRQPEQAVAS